MRKLVRKSKFRPNPMPPFKTLDEEAEFWDTHDLSEFGKVPLLELPLLEKEKEETLILRIQKSVKDRLKRVARAKGLNVGTLSRMWLIEKLSQGS